MFTGLIERVGTIKSATRGSGGMRLAISFGKDPFEIAAGDSVAVDGVCLTAVSLDPIGFSVDVSAESLERSTLKDVRAGGRVNLERALRLGDRMGGHIVTGHVDASGRIAEVVPQGSFTRISIQALPEIMALTVEKGSIAVDGISLTVNAVMKDRFSITIIPETLERTTLGGKRPGQSVNLETDILGKYVARLLGRDPSGGDILEKLGRAGFL